MSTPESRPSHRPVTLFSLTAGTLILAACSTGDGTDASATGGAPAGDGDSAGSGGSASSPCDNEDAPAEAVCIESISGRVIDEDGEPVGDLPVTVCGPVCFRGLSDEDGRFEVELNRFVLVSEYSVQAHGSPGASTFYHRIPLDLEGGRYETGDLMVVSFPEEGDVFVTKLDLDGEAPPAQEVTSGDVTVRVEEDTVVRLTVGDALKGEEGRRFRARELDEEQVEEFVPELEGARVFALGPFEAEFIGDGEREAGVSLAVANTLGWESGESVEVLALGTYLDPDWITPNEFAPIGTAVVSEDGSSIELDAGADGAGLRHVTWIALIPSR